MNKERLFFALNKLTERGKEEAKSLILNAENEVRRIPVNNILYVEAAGHGSVMHTMDEVILLKQSFGEIERQVLSMGQMMKCHRAYLVNLRFVAVILINVGLWLFSLEKKDGLYRQLWNAQAQYYI